MNNYEMDPLGATFKTSTSATTSAFKVALTPYRFQIVECGKEQEELHSQSFTQNCNRNSAQ